MASCARGVCSRQPACRCTLCGVRRGAPHRAQAELGARAEHAYRNLAPVGAEDLLERRLAAARAQRKRAHERVTRARDSLRCRCTKPAGSAHLVLGLHLRGGQTLCKPAGVCPSE